MPRAKQEASHQDFRPVHRCNETGLTLPLTDTIKIKYRFDKILGEHIILWNDILTVFNNAMHVRHGDTAVEYPADEKFEFLQPLRIGAYPGIVLDVIIELPKHNPTSEPPRVYNISISPAAIPSDFQDKQCHPTTTFINSEQLPTSASVDTDSLQTGSVMQQPSSDKLGESSMPSSGPSNHTPRVVLEIENGDTNIPSISTSEDMIENSPPINISSAQGQAEVNLKAIYDQGLAHYDGKGVPQDYLKANDCFLNAASQGYAAAQNKLGYMYRHGQGVPQDYPKAVEWYILAAYQGCHKSQCGLGDMYYDGKGVAQDYDTALTCSVVADWYRKSASQGYIKAQYKLGSLLSGGESMKLHSYKEAFGWFLQAAYQGCAKSQYSIGFMYDSGKVVLLDYPKAVEWFRKAASQGYAPAQSSLGLKYQNGQGVAQNYEIAVEWFLMAADQGHATAQYKLGSMYELGQGVTQDLPTAVEGYQKAASQGNTDAQRKQNKLPRRK
ncbi:hypothetical protein BGX26_008841 [Mortierella sp. AD094]|nr:hypothetical protein BGX26_008841 [Mortierella sp. AD094]